MPFARKTCASIMNGLANVQIRMIQAPKSSASYEQQPEPLLQTTRLPANQARRSASSEDGSESFVVAPDEEPLEVSPSIDYAQYFANFDSRPIQRHLPLKLAIDKRHFMVSCSPTAYQ